MIKIKIDFHLKINNEIKYLTKNDEIYKFDNSIIYFI